MLDILKVKKDLIFVGGFAAYMQGVKSSFHDYDVVVLSLSGGLEHAYQYMTDSKFSRSGRRAVIECPIPVDIFIEDSLPEFIEINGFKCQTVASMLQYYTDLLPHLRSAWADKINDKINILQKWQEKT